MPDTINPHGSSITLDLSVGGSRVAFPLGFSSWSPQLILAPLDTWPTGCVVGLRVSQDGVTWSALQNPVNLTASGLVSPAVPVASYRFGALEVTTAAASSTLATVTSWGGNAT